MRSARLGELCDIQAGGTPSRSRSDFFGGSIPWAKISDIEASDGLISHTEETISKSGLDAIRGRLFPPGTLLFAIYGSIGKMAFTESHISANQAILGIQIRHSDQLDKRFLYHWLKFLQPKLLADGQGIAQKNLSAAYVRDMGIPLPPLDEQQRIAAILDQTDALRSKRREALRRTSDLKLALFESMFGTAIQTANDWPVRALSDVVRAGTIVTYGMVQAGEEIEGGVPYIRTGDIFDGEILTHQLRRADPAVAAKFDRARVETGDIVMSIRATVGTTAMVPSEIDGANLTQGTAKIAPGASVDGIFLLEFLRSAPAQQWIMKQVKGATFREITLGRLREMPVLTPPLEHQKEFSLRVSELMAAASFQLEHLAHLDALFASLQHRAFRGQL